MNSIEKLIQDKVNKINNVIERACNDVIGKYIKETLVYYICETFYNLGYGDDGDLADSLDVKVVFSNNTFTITVYFDDSKINHTSYFGSEKLDIRAGMNVYSVDWINSGKTYVLGSRSVRMEDIGASPRFMEKTVKALNDSPHMMNEFKKYLIKNGIDIR